MTSNLLLVVDSYISDNTRAEACSNLITQLRTYLPEYEILLINKSNNNFDLEKKVDYYFNYGKSFLVGYPPERILDGRYEAPYVYVGTGAGTCENWLPFVGIHDHVAGIYNSFVLSANIAKTLGYNKVFKVEFDTVFDVEELLEIKNDFPKEWDYLFYGKRKEGQWAKPWHYLIDVHICGYPVNLFDDFNIVKNDDEFWQLCDRLGYWGKWIEYIIPHVLEYQNQKLPLSGIHYEGHWHEKFPKTQFDIINGAGGWTEKWKNIPKVCKVSYSAEEDYIPNEYILFYWNDKELNLEVSVKVYDQDELIHDFSINLSPNCYYLEKFPLNNELRIEKTNIYNGTTETYTEIVSPENIGKFNTRFLYN